MGSNGSRVIQIKNVEEHYEQCEPLGEKSKKKVIQIAQSMGLWSVFATRAWSSISVKVLPLRHPILCQSITWSFPTTCSSLISYFWRTLVHLLSKNFSRSSRELAKWHFRERSLGWAATELPIGIGGEWSERGMQDGHISKFSRKETSMESTFHLSK